MRISDWSSDVCSSDLAARRAEGVQRRRQQRKAARPDPCPRQGLQGAAQGGRRHPPAGQQHRHDEDQRQGQGQGPNRREGPQAAKAGSVRPVQAELTPVAGVVKPERPGDAADGGISDESLEAYRRQLQPKVLALFGDDDVTSIPRPELALRIGNLLSQEVDRSGTKLGLLQRRKLVSALIDWLLQCSAMQPDEREALLEPAEMPPARPGAVTPPEGQPKGTVTSHSRVVTAAKSRVHPLVMERLDVSAASQLPRDDLTRQIGRSEEHTSELQSL